MTKRLDSKIGEQDYNGLLASSTPTPLVAAVEVAQGDDALPIGTVVVKGENGTYGVATGALNTIAVEVAEDSGSYTATATPPANVLVLAEEVSAGESTEVVSAYKTGNFVRSMLTAGDYTLTSDDFDYLRQVGILSEDNID